MTADPYRFTISWTNIFPTDNTLCCIMLGTAMAAICPSNAALNSTDFRSVLRAPRRLDRVPRARMAEPPWAIKVAHATPATPSPSRATNQ